MDALLTHGHLRRHRKVDCGTSYARPGSDQHLSLGALGCDMTVFLRYFPAAETMYEVFVALAIGLILLILVWNLFKNFGLGIGTERKTP